MVSEWVWSDYLKVWKCSHCNFTKPYETRGDEDYTVKDFWYCGYCPNCGSKMLNGDANLTPAPKEEVVEE